MKKIETILLKGCAYTVLILSIFYLFGLFGNYEMGYINLSTFLTILIFSFAISLCNNIFNIGKIHIALRTFIHYSVLLTIFEILFLFIGNNFSNSNNKLLSSILIFTVFYIILSVIVYIFRLITAKAEKVFENKKQKYVDKKSTKSQYKPLYKSED